MSVSRRQFHAQNAAKCREEAARTTVDSEKNAWTGLAEEWERLAASPGRWDDASGTSSEGDAGEEFFDQEETGVSRGGVSSHKPPSK
jgi:hypothetical protein